MQIKLEPLNVLLIYYKYYKYERLGQISERRVEKIQSRFHL